MKGKEEGRRREKRKGRWVRVSTPRSEIVCVGRCAVLNAGTQLCRFRQCYRSTALQAAAGDVSRNQSYGEHPPPPFQSLSLLPPIGLPGRSRQGVLEWRLADPHPTISGTMEVGKWGLRTDG